MKCVIVPRIKEFCPGEEIYLDNIYEEQNILYVLYKIDNDTYPDVGKITTEWYGKPRFQYYWGRDAINNLEKFLNANIKERDNLVRLIEDLGQLPFAIEIEVENIFEKYRKILFPTCDLYKLCYYLPTMFFALDIRVYKGKPTFIGRSFMYYGIAGFLMGKLTKEEAMNIWKKVVQNLEPGDIIEKITAIPVRDHYKFLKDERFINKKNEYISVTHHLRLNVKKSKS